MNARRFTDEQLRGAIHAPCLHFFRAEARDTDLCHPHGLAGQ
jgi:hypothetical protein